MLLADSAYGAPRRFRRAWTGFILVLTVLPYLANFWLTPKGETYTWILPPYPADAYAYRAWAKQAYDGHWLFSLKFTALPHRPFLFLPFFLAAGRLARLSGADIGLVHLFLKSVGVVFFFWAFFGFLRHLKLTPRQSIAAAVFAGISSGFGGLAPLVFKEGLSPTWTPVDVWLVDSNTFWSLLWNPLFPFSLALMILSVHCADASLEENDLGRAWTAGLCLAALAFLHPYPLAVLYPLLTALCVLKRPRDWLPFWLRIVGASLPAALSIAALSFLHPLVRTHNDLGTIGSLAPFSYLAGFGLPLALAAAGPFVERGFAKKYWPLFSWLGLSLVLSYCPVWFRIKYIFGAHMPICILAGAASEPLLESLPVAPARKTALAALIVALMSCTQFTNLRAGLAEVEENRDGMFRIPDGMMAGLKYLETRSDHSQLVFAAPPTSAKIAAFSGNTVLWGHWAQAVDSRERHARIRSIFSADSDLSLKERRREFWGPGVEYLFLDGNWRGGFRTGVAPSLLADADEVFVNADVSIYRRAGRAGRAFSPFSNSASHEFKTAVSLGSPISRP